MRLARDIARPTRQVLMTCQPLRSNSVSKAANHA